MLYVSTDMYDTPFVEQDEVVMQVASLPPKTVVRMNRHGDVVKINGKKPTARQIQAALILIKFSPTLNSRSAVG